MKRTGQWLAIFLGLGLPLLLLTPAAGLIAAAAATVWVITKKRDE